MPYTPTIDDLNQWTSEEPSTSGQQAVSPQQGMLSQVANSPGVQFTLGAGDALRNTLASALNVLPKVNIPMAQTGQGMPYDIGKFAGNTAGFMGGGEGLDAIRAASEGLPYAGRLAQALGGASWLPTLGRQAAGSAIYGAIESPDNRLGNAASGAGISAALSALPYGAGKIVQGAQYFRPQKYAQGIVDSLNSSLGGQSSEDMASNILNQLGSGQTLSDNAKSISQAVNTAFKGRKEEGSGLYNSVFNNLSDSPFYQQVKSPDPLMSLDPQSGYTGFYRPLNTKFDQNSGIEGQYPNLSSSITDSYSGNLSDLHDSFIQNPTLQNAHNLNSELSSQIRGMQKNDARGNLSLADKGVLNNYQTAKNSLGSDINNYLSNIDTSLANQYQSATNNWAQNVSPYFSRPKISQMAKGNIDNIGNISTIFKNPSQNTLKVANDLGSDVQNKILFSELGKSTPSSSPQNLVNAFNRLGDKGLGEYVSPQLSSQMSDLQNQINNENFLKYVNQSNTGNPNDLADALKNMSNKGFEDYSNPQLSNQMNSLQRRILATKALQVGAGAGLGSSIGHHLFGAGGWGALSGLAAPAAMHWLQGTLPLEQIASSLSNVLRGTYPATRQATLANALNQSGGQ